MSFQDGLGRIFNVVAAASGVHIPLREGQAVSFVCFLDAGTQNVALKESKSGLSEQALPKISRLYKGPGIGGTWTKITQAAAATFDLTTDATNDCFVFTVGAEQLSVNAGFNSVECTQNAGTCMAIIHELRTQRAPEKLAKQVV